MVIFSIECERDFHRQSSRAWCENRDWLQTMNVARATLAFPIESAPPAGTTVEIAPGILWTRLPLPYRLDHINVYFIQDDRGWAILDSGIADEGCRAAWESLLSGPLAGARFTKLIVTHDHPDHIGLAGWLCEKFGIPLVTSLSSYLGCINVSLNPGAMEQRAYEEFYRSHGMAEDVSTAVRTLGHSYLRLVTPLPHTFRRVVHGDMLTIGSRDFEILIGEGHAPEQVMLYCGKDGLFFAADEVMARITPNIGIWAVDPDGDPLDLYMRSLSMLQAMIDPQALVLPGHHLPFRGLHSRCGELARHHRERCDIIIELCRTSPRAVADLVPALFPRLQDMHQLGFAFNEVHAHVNYLLYRNELQQVASGSIKRVGVA